MTVAANLDECDILFCDTAFPAPDGHGGELVVPPLICSGCGKAWVPAARSDAKPAEGIWGWTAKLFKAFEAGGEKCPFCFDSYGFPYESPQVEDLLYEKRAEWFQEHPVYLDAPTAHSFIFRSGQEAHTLGAFLAYIPGHWEEASWHFTEGHMEQWLRAIGHKEIAAIFRESRRLLGNQPAAFERCVTLLKEYGALGEDF
jgi:hypothetical protein